MPTNCVAPLYVMVTLSPTSGTMTGWFNNGFRGAAVTVEYGAQPGRHRMRVAAPRQLLSVWDARRH